jgi:hypothetical protein
MFGADHDEYWQRVVNENEEDAKRARGGEVE